MPQQLDPQALTAVGLSRHEAVLYAELVAQPGVELSALPELCRRSPVMVATDLVSLVERGLARVSGDVVDAVSPNRGLAPMVEAEAARAAAHRDQLDATREQVDLLQRRHRSARTPVGQAVPIETLRRDDLIAHASAVIEESSGDMCFLRLSGWDRESAPIVDELVMGEIRRGRRSRAIYPAQAFDALRSSAITRARAGEEVRQLATVPLRLAVLDPDLAILGGVGGQAPDEVTLVRHGVIVHALQTVFEALWDQALPPPGLEGLSARPVVDDRTMLLRLMAQGVRDEQMARTLGLSLRTVRRRIAELLEELGAQSRFQAGVTAQRRGWL